MLPTVLTIMLWNCRTGYKIYGKIIWARAWNSTNYVSDAFPLFQWEQVFTSTCYLIQRGNRWHPREKLKFIRKQLLSNHQLTLSSHCVLYLWRQYSYNDTVYFPLYLSFAYLSSICSTICGPFAQMWRLWDIVVQCFIIYKLISSPRKLSGITHVFFLYLSFSQIFIFHPSAHPSQPPLICVVVAAS